MAWNDVGIPKNAYQESIKRVGETMDYMTAMSTMWMGKTQAAITALGEWEPSEEGSPPDIRPGQVHAGALPNLPAPDALKFGNVGDLATPEFEDLRALVEDFDAVDPGGFNPKTGLPTIPAAPAPIDMSGEPTAPVLDDVAIPDAPNITLPAAPALDAISIPDMPTITLPPFDVGTIPTFDEDAPDLSFDWTPTSYDPLVVNDVASTVRNMLAGDYAMPKAVQDALWNSARDRARQLEHQAVEGAMDEWAARGFSMPPGMLVEQTNAAHDAATEAAQTASREVYTQAAQWQIENLRTAVSQGIALEAMWSQHWQATEQRAMEAARVAVDVAREGFNLKVVAFNTQIARVQLLREVFEAKLRAEMAKLDILKGELEAAQLQGTLNEQQVRIYGARLEAVNTQARLYATKLEGVKIHADMERGKIETYKTEVDAWAQKIEADKTRFDAYTARVRGEAAKVDAYEAEARAYAATVRAAADRNQAQNQAAALKLQAVETSVRKFLGLLESENAKITADATAVSARAQAYSADAARWAEEAKYYAMGEENQVRAQEATVRNNMAYYQVRSHQYDSRMARLLQNGNSLKDAITAAGQMSAQMAAGAMSAIHTQASISGRGSVSTNYSYDVAEIMELQDKQSNG